MVLRDLVIFIRSVEMKLKVGTVILGGIILGNLNVLGSPVARLKYVCPIGGEKFEDSYVPQCPENKFVMFKEKFTDAELKKYEKIINGKDYREIPKDAGKYYYLGRFYELAKGFSDKEIGEAYYDSYYRDYSENQLIIKEALQKGISYLEKSFETKKEETPWKLLSLYAENKEYGKMNKILEGISSKDLEEAVNFYYDLADIELSNGFERVKNKIQDKNDKRMIVNKALEFLQKEIAESKEGANEEQLLRQAKLYRELGEKEKIDNLFSKSNPKYYKAASLFYMDEPENFLGYVYHEKKLSTNSELTKSINYIDKAITNLDNEIKNSQNSKNSETLKELKAEKVDMLLIKAEANRRLNKFNEAEKIINSISEKDITEINKSMFDDVKKQIKSKNSKVMQYIPPQIMY